MAEEIGVDSKGRIVIPDSIRRRLGIRRGSRLKVKVEQNSIVITKNVKPDEFITEMEGFLKEGSNVPVSNPLKLKGIWLQQ